MNEPNFEAAVIYGRVSTDRQDASLEAQDAKAQDYVRTKGLELAQTFMEGDISGGKPLGERPQGSAMLQFLERNIQVRHVVVTKLDRLGRSVLDLEQMFAWFRQRQVTLHIVDFGGDSVTTAGFIGDFMLRIIGAFAELERMMIRSRVQEGIDRKRAKGEVAGTVPFGWDAVGTGRLNARGVEIRTELDNLTEQAWLLQVHRWRHVDGWSLRQIARALNEAGVKTKVPQGTLICVGKDPATGERLLRPSSGRWDTGNVRHLLTNKRALEWVAGRAA